MKYRIKWVDEGTGATGHGKPMFDSYDEAKAVAEAANREEVAEAASGDDKDTVVWHSVEAVEEGDDSD